MKKTNKKGFTLAELLVVVAIIAVLVAIAIPIFTAQLEKAREATDAANLRAAYAELAVDILDEDTVTPKKVELTQTINGWEYVDEIADVPTAKKSDTDTTGKVPATKGATIQISVDASGKATFTVAN